MSDGLVTLLFAVGVLAVVAKVFYDTGYKRGQEDLLNPPSLRSLTEDEQNRLLMRATLPRWRRWMGWVAILIPGLLWWVLLIVVMRQRDSRWWHFAMLFLSFMVTMVLGIRLMDWFWRPYRQAQEAVRQARDKEDRT
jgi:hypothetical protein